MDKIAEHLYEQIGTQFHLLLELCELMKVGKTAEKLLERRPAYQQFSPFVGLVNGFERLPSLIAEIGEPRDYRDDLAQAVKQAQPPTVPKEFDWEEWPGEATLSSGNNTNLVVAKNVTLSSHAIASVVVCKTLNISSGASVGSAYVFKKLNVSGGGRVGTLYGIRNVKSNLSSGGRITETKRLKLDTLIAEAERATGI